MKKKEKAFSFKIEMRVALSIFDWSDVIMTEGNGILIDLKSLILEYFYREIDENCDSFFWKAAF